MEIMKKENCLLCNRSFENETKLKDHYVKFHNVNENKFFFFKKKKMDLHNGRFLNILKTENCKYCDEILEKNNFLLLIIS